MHSRRVRSLVIVGSLGLVGVACSSTSTTTTPTSGPGATAATGSTAGRTGSSSAPGTTVAPSFDTATQQQLQAVLDSTRADYKFPGVIAGVWSPTGTWIGTSGTTGQNQTAAPTSSDHTRIGSVTKTFTVTLLLQLVEQGKVSLDDTISKYVPGMPNGDIATLRQLADMTSGIPSYTGEDGFLNTVFVDHQRQWTPEQLVDFVRGTQPLFAPGKGWNYSNTNTVLLGMVVEKVTGQPISEVYQERILGPLGMTQSSFPTPGTNGLPEPHLSGITNQGQPDGQTADATNWNPSYSFTAGEVISTLDDVRRWSIALRTGEGVLKPETQKQRLASLRSVVNGDAVTGDEDGYGLGIGRRGGWWGHTGEIFGYNTVLNFKTDDGTTIIVLVNSDVPLANSSPPKNPAPAVFAGLAEVLAGPSGSSTGTTPPGSAGTTTTR